MRASQYMSAAQRTAKHGRDRAAAHRDNLAHAYVPLTDGINGSQRIRIGEGNTSEELIIPTDLGPVS